MNIAFVPGMGLGRGLSLSGGPAGLPLDGWFSSGRARGGGTFSGFLLGVYHSGWIWASTWARFGAHFVAVKTRHFTRGFP